MGMHASVNITIGYRSIDHLVTEVLHLPWPNASNMAIEDLALEVNWEHARRIVLLPEEDVKRIPFDYQNAYWALVLAIQTAQEQSWLEHPKEHEACYHIEDSEGFHKALRAFYNKHFTLVFV